MRKLRNSELNRLSIEEYKNKKKSNIIVILDNIRSLHNIGSVFRTCDGMGISNIYLCGISSTPENKEIRKTSLGAEESIDWKYFETTIQAIEKIKKKNGLVFAVEQTEDSISLKDFELNTEVITGIIFGHEVKGVSQEAINHSDGTIEIPMGGTKHSYNISVSAGIVLWELVRPVF